MKLYFLFAFMLAFSLMISGQDISPDTLIILEAVEVIESPASDQAYSVSTIERKEIDVLPVHDIGGLLRVIPNVNGVKKGGAVSDPVVRGFKYSQLNVQLNGGQKIEGGCPNRMDPAVAHIDVDDIRSIEVIKGPFALQYGPNFGGVVNMKTVTPLPRNKFGVNVGAMMGYESNWNGFKNRLSIDGGNDKVFFSLSGNMKKYGNYTDGNGIEVRSEFEKYNYTAQLGINPFKHNYLIISYDQSYGKNVLFPSLPMDERSDDTRLMSLDYKVVQISKTFQEFNVKFYLSDVSHLMDNKQRPFSDTVVAVSDIQARNYGFKVDANFHFGDNELLFGTDYEHILKDGERTKTKILEPGMPSMSEKLWDDAQIQNNGLFALYHRRWGAFLLDGAVRVDFNRATSSALQLVKMGNEVYYNDDVSSDYTNFSFSIGARYIFSEKFSMKLALGRGVRSPDMNERFIILLPIGYDNYDYLGNPQLKPEANTQADISAAIDLPEAGVIEGGLFFSYVKDYITGELVAETEVRPQTRGVYGVKKFTNEDHVYLGGFELSYATPTKFDWGANARLALTRGINPEATKYTIENGEITGSEIVKNDPLPEIPPLEGAIELHYKLLKGKLIPFLNLRMVASQKNISEAYMEKESPGFTLLDFRLIYQFNDYLKFSGGVSNIFDKAYYEHLNRRIIGGKGNLYEPGRVFYAKLYFNI